MVAFNAWYYSFSPYVANYIANHWVERTIMKGVLYPLIGMLFLTNAVFTAAAPYPEFAALLSGLIASSLIGAFYLGLPIGFLRARVRRLRNWKGERLFEQSLWVDTPQRNDSTHRRRSHSPSGIAHGVVGRNRIVHSLPIRIADVSEDWQETSHSLSARKDRNAATTNPLRNFTITLSVLNVESLKTRT